MIDVAADLYAEVLKLEEWGDKEEHRKLRKKASELLGVKFSTRQLFDELKSRCHPKNFTSSYKYNAEKVKLANHYFQKISENCDDIDALELLEREINNVFPNNQLMNEGGDTEDNLWGLVFLVLLGIIILIAFIADAN